MAALAGLLEEALRLRQVASDATPHGVQDGEMVAARRPADLASSLVEPGGLDEIARDPTSQARRVARGLATQGLARLAGRPVHGKGVGVVSRDGRAR